MCEGEAPAELVTFGSTGASPSRFCPLTIQRMSSMNRFVLPLAIVFAFTAETFASDKPNVLLITIDDLNDWVGCLGGHPQAKTPNIDRLAKRGTLFTNAHCQAPICNPSRTSFMLGLRPSTTGIYLNSPWFRTTPANKDRVTMSQYFAQHGYSTLTTGKIYHGSRVDDLPSKRSGLDPGNGLLKTNGLSKTSHQEVNSGTLVLSRIRKKNSVTLPTQRGRSNDSKNNRMTGPSFWPSDSIDRMCRFTHQRDSLMTFRWRN